jgi:acetylornithine deacetylase
LSEKGAKEKEERVAIGQKLAEAVEAHRNEALELLQELVRTPSLEGDERACQEIVAGKLTELGLALDVWSADDEELAAHPAFIPTGRSYRDRPNVVGVLHGSGAGRSLILNGHVDVVPTGAEETWTHSPWSGHFEQGRVYGRGACDMKAGIVSNILAARAVMACGIRLQGDLIIESVVDEEAGGNGTLACVMRGYRGDACIFTEPTGLTQMAISGRGAQFFRITVPGQEGGVEYKHQLINPIAKAAYSIMRESVVSHPLYDHAYHTKVPTGICKFHAGEWPSTVASRAVLEGTIECLPGEDIHAVKGAFETYLMEWSAKDPWLKDHPLKLEWFGLWFDAAEIPPDHTLVEELSRVTESVTGQTPLVRGGGGSDLRLPILYGDTPAVLFGPGGGMIHSTDEYVEFEQVVSCAKILAGFALEWCGHEGWD